MRTINDTDKQNNINTDIPDQDDERDQVVPNDDLRLMILVSDTDSGPASLDLCYIITILVMITMKRLVMIFTL